MRGRSLLLSAALLLAGCGQGGSTSGRVVPCPDAAPLPEGPDYLVRGTLVHQRGERFTYDGEFVARPDAHATIELYYVLSEDGVSETIAKQCIAGVTSLPLSFRIPGTPAAVYGRRGLYGLIARVHGGAGDQIHVGDLVNEARVAVTAAARDLSVNLTGIEKCGTPESGGFCSDLVR